MEANILRSLCHYLELVLASVGADDVLESKHFANLVILKLSLICDGDPSCALPTIWRQLHERVLNQILNTNKHLNTLLRVFTQQWVIHHCKHVCLLHLRHQVPQPGL